MFAVMVFLGLSTAFGQSKTDTISVNGNCVTCKTRIETTAKSINGVSAATWNIDTKILSVTFDASKTSLDAIAKSIAAVGHDNRLYKAPDGVYNNLPSCCKYDRTKIIPNQAENGTMNSCKDKTNTEGCNHSCKGKTHTQN